MPTCYIHFPQQLQHQTHPDHWTHAEMHSRGCLVDKQQAVSARQCTFCFLLTEDIRVLRVFWAVSLSVGGAIKAMPVDRPTISTSSCRCQKDQVIQPVAAAHQGHVQTLQHDHAAYCTGRHNHITPASATQANT